ncbi:hypothetical protein EKG37_07295 [Robertmurraya yapensis]|uniref:Nucleotidyltransferase family protein n=1 Tax=Bacillus yapensis TaxID=2492960 RepID=A0A3S0IHC7_9BACI|nr:hypothetical protein [Bacillus yapensis]RTR34009.1 hypothetical protein EKG37_07295 [Bacillus yapensis]TKS97327.1 hypothetical protein FAR12_07295 [Bacillus yapensis]
MDKYNEFLTIAKTLNQELKIIPVLYGSLGLSRVAKVDFSPQDIDILVPFIFLKERWPELKTTIEGLGYELTDLHEHEFRKAEFKIGIAYLEDLRLFADVDYKSLLKNVDDRAVYYTLSISDYKKVYSKSLLDGYRRNKNNNKDQRKLDFLNEFEQKGH